MAVLGWRRQRQAGAGSKAKNYVHRASGENVIVLILVQNALFLSQSTMVGGATTSARLASAHV